MTRVRDALRGAAREVAGEAAEMAEPLPSLKAIFNDDVCFAEIERIVLGRRMTDPQRVWSSVAEDIARWLDGQGIRVRFQPSSVKAYYMQVKRGDLSVRVEQVKPANMLAQAHVDGRKEPVAEPVIEVAKPSTSEVAEGHRAPSAPPPSLHPRRSQQDKEAEKEAVARLLDKSNSPFLTVRSDATTNKEV